jgi:hypothetical protein
VLTLTLPLKALLLLNVWQILIVYMYIFVFYFNLLQWNASAPLEMDSSRFVIFSMWCTKDIVTFSFLPLYTIVRFDYFLRINIILVYVLISVLQDVQNGLYLLNDTISCSGQNILSRTKEDKGEQVPLFFFLPCFFYVTFFLFSYLILFIFILLLRFYFFYFGKVLQ